jgi:chorismate--pyruvate lyase
MQRSDMEITALHHDHMCYPWTRHPGSETIWGRRSVFRLQKKPLLVSEFFLPGVRGQD